MNNKEIVIATYEKELDFKDEFKELENILNINQENKVKFKRKNLIIAFSSMICLIVLVIFAQYKISSYAGSSNPVTEGNATNTEWLDENNKVENNEAENIGQYIVVLCFGGVSFLAISVIFLNKHFKVRRSMRIYS